MQRTKDFAMTPQVGKRSASQTVLALFVAAAYTGLHPAGPETLVNAGGYARPQPSLPIVGV